MIIKFLLKVEKIDLKVQLIAVIERKKISKTFMVMNKIQISKTMQIKHYMKLIT